MLLRCPIMENHGKPGSTLMPQRKASSRMDTIPKMSSVNCCLSGWILLRSLPCASHKCRIVTVQFCVLKYNIFTHTLFLKRSWCPDRTLAQARKYVRKSMGSRFAEPVILNLHATWEESDSRTPLICFLSMGSDPTDQIEALAKNLELGKA